LKRPEKSLIGEISLRISDRPSSRNFLNESFCIFNKSGISKPLVLANESLEF
jgi:hypothetical protein